MHNKYYQCDRHKMMIVAGAGGGGKYSCSLENTNGMNCNTIFKLHYLHTFLPSPSTTLSFLRYLRRVREK